MYKKCLFRGGYQWVVQCCCSEKTMLPKARNLIPLNTLSKIKRFYSPKGFYRKQCKCGQNLTSFWPQVARKAYPHVSSCISWPSFHLLPAKFLTLPKPSSLGIFWNFLGSHVIPEHPIPTNSSAYEWACTYGTAHFKDTFTQQKPDVQVSVCLWLAALFYLRTSEYEQYTRLYLICPPEAQSWPSMETDMNIKSRVT